MTVGHVLENLKWIKKSGFKFIHVCSKPCKYHVYREWKFDLLQHGPCAKKHACLFTPQVGSHLFHHFPCLFEQVLTGIFIRPLPTSQPHHNIFVLTWLCQEISGQEFLAMFNCRFFPVRTLSTPKRPRFTLRTQTCLLWLQAKCKNLCF